MTQQPIDLQTAREAGEQAAALCLDRARRADPEFVAKATAAILAHLRASGQASGEELVDVAIAHGAHCPDQRAFGAVFATLSRKHLIRTVGFCMRAKGHATAGGRIWQLASAHSFDAPQETGKQWPIVSS
jgi:hypothetical protein